METALVIIAYAALALAAAAAGFLIGYASKGLGVAR